MKNHTAKLIDDLYEHCGELESDGGTCYRADCADDVRKMIKSWEDANMEKHVTETGLERFIEWLEIDNSKRACTDTGIIWRHYDHLIDMGEMFLIEERAAIAKATIPATKGLVDELKNWAQKTWQYNGPVHCEKEYGFSVAQNQVLEIINRYTQPPPKQEDTEGQTYKRKKCPNFDKCYCGPGKEPWDGDCPENAVISWCEIMVPVPQSTQPDKEAGE